jgi:uncharacterized protein (TIGR03067 family)
MKPHIPLFAGVTWLFVGLSTLLAADDTKLEAIKKDRARYFGEWQVVSLEVDGNKITEEDFEKFTVVNGMDGTWNITVDGAIMVQGSSEIDPTQTPKTVDLKITQGAGSGDVVPGIYELGEDARKVCLGQAGKERPKEFSAPAGSGRVLALLKRLKK